MTPFSFNSFVIGGKDQLAVKMEKGSKEHVVLLNNPQVSDVTIEQRGDIEIAHSINGDRFQVPQDRHITATITVQSIDWEMITGQNLGNELPDVVDEMSVEELLAAVNQKIDEREP